MERSVTRIEPTVVPVPSLLQVCGYARVSTPKDAMIHSLSSQVSYYNKLIQNTKGWAFAGVFVDEAKTGTKDTRSGFREMLEACRAGRINLVVTKSISRFARNTVVLLQTVRELKALHVDVYFERENIHSISADGELMLTILASFAEEESRSASENIKWRIKAKYDRGQTGGVSMYGFRLVDGVLRIVPDEADVIQQVAELYLAGYGFERIVKWLTDIGAKPKRGEHWCNSAIREMLFNEKVGGDLLLQKYYVEDPISKKLRKNTGQLEQIHVAGAHKAILDKETVRLLQEERASRVARFKLEQKTPARYPFTGMLVCGICGAHFRRKIAGSATPYKKPTWICSTYNQKGKHHCASRQIPESILMELAAGVLKIPVFDSDTFATMVKEIQVPAVDRLVFHFHNGTQVACTWQNKSRSESWTAERRQKQRDMMKREEPV